jgi:predicted ATP-dependent endonuclease of OLD family
VKLLSFRAKNFKGIEDATVTLSGRSEKVYSFVGLNESGKTTILEALAAYNGWTETLKPVTANTLEKLDHLAYVPKHSISNFTGDISIIITCFLDEEDKKVAIQSADEQGYHVESIGNVLTRYQHFRFADSKYVKALNQFGLAATGYSKKARKKVAAELPVEVRSAMSDSLKDRFPAVLYFPNAIFDTPDEIILSDGGRATEKDAYYRLVLQDALDSIGKNLVLDQHVTARIGDSSQLEALSGTIKQLELKITEFVFKAWKDILGQDMANRRIELSTALEGEERILRIRYVSGADSYKISERSLGFRWFFGFLLLTQFRKKRQGDNRQVIYVFDEPASNLHSSAQKKLLQIFGQLAEDCPILYSTHSHHLISPDWLESAYVVRNTGLTYEDSDLDYSSKDASTKVLVQPYRQFVASYPDQTTYYQPILDVLDYKPSHLEFVPKVVFCEGKNDYYTLRMFQQQSECPAQLNDVKIVPGNGGNGLDPLIKLYSGWGASFQILLDSDKGGAKGKKQYEKAYGFLVDDRVHTIDDLVSGHSGAMEAVLSVTDKAKILEVAGQKDKSPDKSLLNKCIQECCARGLAVPLEQATVKKFEAMLKGLADKL